MAGEAIDKFVGASAIGGGYQQKTESPLGTNNDFNIFEDRKKYVDLSGVTIFGAQQP